MFGQMLADPIPLPARALARDGASTMRRCSCAHRVHARDDAPGAAARAPAAQRGAAGPLRPVPVLLIVDDDALMTQLLPRRLRQAFGPRLEIVTATTPEDAARIVRETRPDIILSDYNLRAAHTGLDVLADAADVHPTGVRILFSGHTRAEIGPRMHGAPIHGFLEKPFRLDDLIAPFAAVVHQASRFDLGPAPPHGDA